MSPVWALAGRGAVRCEDGLAAHVGYTNGRINNTVVSTVAHSHLRVTILSLRLQILSSCLSILPRSLMSVAWHDFSADLRPATSSASSLYSFKAHIAASLSRSHINISHTMVRASLTACRGRSTHCSLQVWMMCAM
jgi:hypothetical protein